MITSKWASANAFCAKESCKHGSKWMYICKQKSNKINVLWINWYPNDLNPCHAANGPSVGFSFWGWSTWITHAPPTPNAQFVTSQSSSTLWWICHLAVEVGTWFSILGRGGCCLRCLLLISYIPKAWYFQRHGTLCLVPRRFCSAEGTPQRWPVWPRIRGV